MSAKTELENMRRALDRIHYDGGNDEDWKTVYRAIGYLGEMLWNIGYQVGVDPDVVEIEKLSRVTPRGGAGWK